MRRGPGLLPVLALLALLGPARAEEPVQGILDEVARYDAQLAELDSADAKMTAREAELHAALDAHTADETNAATEIAQRRVEVDRALRAAYRLQRRGFARLLFDAQSPDELRRRVHYLLATVRTQEAAMSGFEAVVQKRADAASAAEAEIKALDALAAERTAQRQSLQEERNRRLALLRSVRGSPPMAGQYLAESSRARSDFESSVAVHSAPAPASTGEGFRDARGTLPWPLRGRLIQGWGPYVDDVTHETLQSLGFDISAPPGTPFRAVYAGTVTRSGYIRGYGQVVMVQHGTYATLYAHANGLRVSQGQEVKAGDVLGLVGSTGLLDESEARLHFEVRYNGTPQDPGMWIAG